MVSGMTDASQSYKNFAALTLYVDTNIIDALDETAVTLRRLCEEGWINLQRTDAMDTELADASEGKWPELTEQAHATQSHSDHSSPVSLGPTPPSSGATTMSVVWTKSSRSSARTQTERLLGRTTYVTPCTLPRRFGTEATDS